MISKSLCLSLQHRSHEFFDIFNNGTAVPVRSSSFLTMGTAFLRVPRRNDPWGQWRGRRDWGLIDLKPPPLPFR